MQTDSAPRYDRTAMMLHWLIALFIFILFSLGWYMVGLPKRTPAVGFFYNLHKSIGVVAGSLIAVRVFWRVRHRPPPLPAHMPPWQIALSNISHSLLYLAIIVMPLSGFVASNFRKTGIVFFGMPLPPLGWDDKKIYGVFNFLHICASYVLAALILIHVLAAIKHAIDRDGVMRRMLPACRKNQSTD